ncbi:LOG family protein [Marihabitans asiaticum]|uniref:Putative Rossmann-fold nucleotide-binding protein n=1 Tax=Marihabitans asiaticum TaxID=415218 RepID=A0A560W9P9_9MICO|nr:LOG family protein [Marihabitans asiaticum]TWD14357.1 putative Rossmann-fold nucleotide-binding protein [Marihabitans asiaticum]
MTRQHRPEVVSDETRTHPAAREVATPTDLREVLATRAPLRGVRIQDLDLHPFEGLLLARTELDGLVILGGRLSDRLATHLRLHGALVFPTDPGVPINPYRATLYQAGDLYEDLTARGYAATPDARAYEWSQDKRTHRDTFATLLRAIHDDSMTDALTEQLAGRQAVGVMGGHALQRGTPEYADAATLGHALADAGLVVITGGGPGAMEAANLGAFAGSSDRLAQALDRLATVPSFRPSIDDWAQVAMQTRTDLREEKLRDGTTGIRSVGIPTWFYGHEPPNVFCGGIAKYFSNAVREDALLSRSTAGLVVLPGAAGTVQEIFQAVTPLYYAGVGVPVPPLILVDSEHWTRTIPVVPALEALGAQRELGSSTHLVDDVAEAAELILAR